MKNIFNYKDINSAPALKDVDEKKGIVTGYFAHFGNVDSDGDIIVKGAFEKTIRENGPSAVRPRIKHLMNHDVNKPLGKLTVLREDATGLYYESLVGTHSAGRDFIKMAESGLITEHSIGYRTIKFNQLQTYEQYLANPEAGWRELTEIKLYEGSSLTGWGANPLTPLTGLKNLKSENIDIDLLVKKSESIEKFCRNTDATDDAIEMLTIFNKQLAQLIIDLTQPAQQEAVEPKKGEEPDWKILTELLIN